MKTVGEAKNGNKQRITSEQVRSRPDLLCKHFKSAV